MNKYIKKVNEFCMLSKNFDIKTAFDYIKNRHTLGHEKFSIYVQNFLRDILNRLSDIMKMEEMDYIQ